MIEVSSGPGGPSVDVCRSCKFIWFDPLKLEGLPAAETPAAVPAIPNKASSGALAQAGAVAKGAERPFGWDAPHELWKYLPGLLGMPVEYEQSPFHAVPLLTLGLIAFISAFSIRAFANIEQAAAQFGLIPAVWSRDFGLTFLTSFLLHANYFHLIGNMYFLFIFGHNVEGFLGKTRYLLLILIAAVVGDLTHIAMDPRSHMPLIGASGGISGVVAFYALKFPKARLGVLFRLGLIPIRWFRVPAYAYVAFWIALQVFGAYAQIRGLTNIASLAHLGGAAAGLAFWVIFRHH
jgi:membrane associated rhomboid family serine protease